jgi:hypothetical protein
MKGIEGLPLKYVVMILAASVIIVSVLYITNVFTGMVIIGTEQTNQTLNTILDQAIVNIG